MGQNIFLFKIRLYQNVAHFFGTFHKPIYSQQVTFNGESYHILLKMAGSVYGLSSYGQNNIFITREKGTITNRLIIQGFYRWDWHAIHGNVVVPSNYRFPIDWCLQSFLSMSIIKQLIYNESLVKLRTFLVILLTCYIFLRVFVNVNNFFLSSLVLTADSVFLSLSIHQRITYFFSLISLSF